MIRTKVICEICGAEISKSNINAHLRRHQDHPETFIQYHVDHEGLYCKFCGRLCKHLNSLTQHEMRCSNNENSIQQKVADRIKNFNNVGRTAWNKGLKLSPEARKNFLDKQAATKTQNNSWHVSRAEERYYEYLLTKYAPEDIRRQYKDSERYPFYCDFYIVSEDKFIECNFHWTHNTHSFDPSNPKDIQEAQLLVELSRSSDYYKLAHTVWTQLDVQKLQCAKLNNLNYEIVWKQPN